MKVKANVWTVRGNSKEITGETNYIGTLEVIPMPNGTAWIMAPVIDLVEKNEFNRRVGIPEIRPLSLFDKELRCKVELTQKEAEKAFSLKPGETLKFKRFGWGEEWNNTIKRVE